jgi:hypothetical protein
MRYIVCQTFESLGDPQIQKCVDLGTAEVLAQSLKEAVQETVEELETSEIFNIGCEVEFRAWTRALDMSEGSDRYTPEAAKFVAECCVRILEADDE